MSKITTAKKEAKLKGKAKKIAESNARKAKETTETLEAPKPSVPNSDRCCHCKHYGKIPHESGHQCKLTGKYTPRKATCPEHKFRG